MLGSSIPNSVSAGKMIAVKQRLKRRRYPSWPEIPALSVNVLCEGPSISEVSERDLLDGPVIAINHAIALSRALPIDFWAKVDRPDILWRWARQHLGRQVKIFTTENNILLWEEIIGRQVNDRLYAHRSTFMVPTKDDPDGFLSDDGKHALLPTLTHLLGWLYGIPGVQRVRLFGVDMRGSGSPLAEEAFSEDMDSGWKFRWIVERRLLALSARQFRRCGKRIERWDNKARVTANK